MKKTVIISSVTTAILLVLFIISVMATGVNMEKMTDSQALSVLGFSPVFDSDGQSYGFGEVVSKTFSEDVNRIEVVVSSAETIVRTAETNSVTVKYTAGDTGKRFSAKVANGKLIVKETVPNFVLFRIGPGKHSKLEIELPEKEYGDVDFKAASGSIKVSGIVCGNFIAETASGSGEYSVFAKEIKADTASGSVKISNCTGDKAQSIRISNASGSTEVSGFLAESFRIDCASGSVRADGISGKGDVDAASGNIYLRYAEWDSGLEIDAASGLVDVQLPTGSGADIDNGSMSGSVRYDLDGETGSVGRNGAASVGGSNSHGVDVEMMSGTVNLHN